MKIRKAKKREFKEIAGIYKKGFNEKPFKENWNFNESFRKIKIFSKYCDIWVAILDKEIIGFFIINPYHGKLEKLSLGKKWLLKKNFVERILELFSLNLFLIIIQKRGIKNLWE